ncbi:uncharacterized protein LOC118647409 isoform X1 [Monomorium pharaonis]|uniref:uncharacterized protein LOC118647409 isoform X1 n=1 Tax=Monomorium pharaonis TaxID=307658 RepID=UPI00174620DD|nr:uncharacterized protein LOC118647409 isoform X1 [Monomorium pharaonis]
MKLNWKVLIEIKGNMNWTTRKAFHNLSSRQQYNRLCTRRGFHLSVDKTHLQNQNESNNFLIYSSEKNHYHVTCGNLDSETKENLASTTYFEETSLDFSSQTPSAHDNVVEEIIHEDSQLQNIEIDCFENFQNLLRQCCLDMNINHLQTEAILRVLRSHKCFRNLPKDSKTLLKTSRDRINFIPIGSGVYWHIGFVKPLEKHLSFYAANEIPPVLEIELNTDGLSLSKSNPMQYWPLQYRVINIPYFKPMIIGVYKGLDKPCNVYKFFENLLNEVKEANRLGGILIRNHHISIVFKNFVADAAARALVLNHYGHNSSNPCSKCKVSGFRHENRTVYLGINHKKRTNEQYIYIVWMKTIKKEKADLGIPIVTNVPFEIMHLVYLDVTMRLLNAWYDGKFGYAAKLRSSELNEMSSRYVELNKFCPNEFARRPRSLAKFSIFKATELRHFFFICSTNYFVRNSIRRILFSFIIA